MESNEGKYDEYRMIFEPLEDVVVLFIESFDVVFDIRDVRDRSEYGFL